MEKDKTQTKASLFARETLIQKENHGSEDGRIHILYLDNKFHYKHELGGTK